MYIILICYGDKNILSSGNEIERLVSGCADLGIGYRARVEKWHIPIPIPGIDTRYRQVPF